MTGNRPGETFELMCDIASTLPHSPNIVVCYNYKF